MRIILLIVFYVVAYVARIAAGGGIATTMPGNGTKHILGRKVMTTRNRISGVLADDDEMTRKTMKRSKRSLLVNRIDDFLQNSRDLNGKLARVGRSVRKRTRHAKNSEDKIVHLDFKNNDGNDDRNDVTSNAKGLQGPPVWQIPEPTVSTVIDLTTNPMINRLRTINRSSFTLVTLPSHFAYLNSDGVLEFDNAIFTTRANLRGISDESPETLESGLILDDNRFIYQPKMILSKIPVYILSYPAAKYNIDVSDKNIIFLKIPNTKLVKSQRFRWQFSGYQKNSPKSHNIKKQLRNNRLTKRRFLLIPLFKDVYMLKNVGDRISRSRTDKNNVTSAILSFKAHMHHDSKNLGRAYFRRGSHNYRLFEHNANGLHSKPDMSFDIVEENTKPMENSMSLFNSLYPDIVSQAYSGLIDTTPEISDGSTVFHISNRMNISEANVDSHINPEEGVGSYDSTSFFDMPAYGVSLRPEGNINNRQRNMLPAIKTDKTDAFRLNSRNYEEPLEYIDLVESTTMAFRNLLDVLDNRISTSSITLKGVAMYLNDSEMYDVSQNIRDNTKLSMSYENQDVDKQDVTDYILTQYKLTSDAIAIKDYTTFSDTTYAFSDNILSNRDIDMTCQKGRNADNGESVISNDFCNEKSTDTNNLIYNDKFTDEALLSGHTTEMTLFSDTDQLSLKRQESTIENSRNLLMAIKPLSSELEKLLNAVKLINISISNVQSRLCDKKDVAKSTRIERDGLSLLSNSTEQKAVKRTLSIEDLGRQFRGKKRSKTKSRSSSKARNAVGQRVDDIQLKKRTNDYFLLLNRLTTPLRKRASLANDAGIQSGDRNVVKEQKLNGRRFSKSNDIERRRSPHLRLNRSLKSLNGNYGLRMEPMQMTRSTTPIIRLLRLVRNDVSSKNNFLNECTQNSRRYKSIVLSANTTNRKLDWFANKDNETYFFSNNNKRDLKQRDTSRLMSNETSVSNREKEFPDALSPIDPQFYTEATAYLDILRLLNRTEEPYIEQSPTDWTVQNVTNLLFTLISTTSAFPTTITFMPYLVERSTAVPIAITLLKKEKLPGITQVSYEHETAAPYFEYYKYDKDYNERNYTEMYENYDEYEGNITSWYDYTEEITTEMHYETTEVNATTVVDLASEFIFENTTTSVEITKTKMDYDMETVMPVETIMRYTMAEYPFIITTTGILITAVAASTIITESLETIPVSQLTLSALNVSIETTPPLFYTTQLPILTAITITEIITDEIVTSLTAGISTEATESTVAIPKTESFTNESMMVLTPILEGITGITLRITIPASIELPLGETPSLIPAMTMRLTEKKITESISMPQTRFNETGTFLDKFSIEPMPETMESERTTIWITTPIGPVLTPLITTKRFRTTPMEKTVSATEGTITVTDIIPVAIIDKSTVTSDENVTLYKCTTSSVTYVATLEAGIEKVTPRRISTTPTNITTRLMKEASVAEDTETTFMESTSAEIISKQPRISTETSFITFMERISTNITIVSTLPITQITESTIETLTTLTTISEITTARFITVTITSTPTRSIETLSISTEIAATTIGYATAEEESPMTSQIEKAITAEETTTIETIATIETSITIEILTTTESTMATETPITVQASIITLTPTSTETRTSTEISITTETPTTIEIPILTSTTTENRTTSEIPRITETSTVIGSIKTTENQTITEISTTGEILRTTSTTTEIPTSIETVQIRNITEILVTIESPMTVQVATLTETLTTIKITPSEIINETSTASESTKTTENITTAEISTIVETLKFTEISTTIETLVTATTPTSIETRTVTEVLITTGSLTPIKTPIIPTINITTLSTTESTISSMFLTKEFLSTPTVTMKMTPFLTDVTLNETISATIFTAQSSEETEVTSPIVSTAISLINDSLITPFILPITKTSSIESFDRDSSILEQVTIETTETSLITTTVVSLLTTERPEHEKILEVAVTVTLAPFAESYLSTLITSEIFTTISEVTFALSSVALKMEDLTTTMSTIEMSYTAENFSIAITMETSEAETEYYAETEKEKYEGGEEECDTEIPTDSWYEYEEYEIATRKETITSTIKHTRLVEEGITSLSVDKGTTTSPYKTKTSEFTTLSVEIRVETVSTIFTASEKGESSTTGSTFGSTEEYILPSTTIFEITTKPLPLEHPRVLSTRDVGSTLESSTQAWRDVTLPKFITKPKEIPDRESKPEKISSFEKIDVTSERDLTMTQVFVEKLTFISSMLPTLSEEELIKAYVTTSTAFSDFEKIEAITVVDYEATTQPMSPLLITEESKMYDFITAYDTDVAKITSEEIIPYTTLFVTSKIEIARKQLLQRLDELKRLEEELAEREENLKKKQRQWDKEKERRKKTMLREQEKKESITAVIGASTVYVTTIITDLTSATLILTDIGMENLSTSAVTEIGVTFPILDTIFTTTSSPSLDVITLTSTETTPFYTTEKSTYVKYTVKRVEEITTQCTTIESISTMYATEETEEIYATSYETSLSFTSPTLITFTNLTISAIDEFTTLPTTTFSMYDSIDLTSVAIPIYTTEERYATSYTDRRYKESTFSLPTLTFTSSITLALDEFTLSITTSIDTFDEIGVTFVPAPTSYIAEETSTAIYKDVYSEPSSVSPTLMFADTTVSPISSTLAIGIVAKIEYDEEIENLKQELYKRERELDEREKMLLEREEALEKDVAEFERYMEKLGKEQIDMSIALSEEPMTLTNLSTPVPPIEKTTIKVEITKQVKKTTKKENRTTEVVMSQDEISKMKEEKERTRYVPEETVTREEEVVTKRICLNVLENTTVPLDKRRKDIVVKKICLPYFPERNREKKLIGRLSRKLLVSRDTSEIREPKTNLVSNFRYRRSKATTLKISNLQLSRHEWLSNETTKLLRYFKGFTRIYGRTTQMSKNVATSINAQESITNHFPDGNTSHEGDTLRQRENFFQPATVSMLNVKECRKRDVSFDRSPVSERVNNVFDNYKISDEKTYISPMRKNTPLMEGKADLTSEKVTIKNHSTANEKKSKENGNESYTVNVLRLAYNKNEETHEVISIKPDQDESTTFMSGSNEYDDGKDEYNYVNEKTETNAKSYYELEEKNDLKEKDGNLFEGIEDVTESDDYIESMTENYMHYEKHETSIHGRILDDQREQRTTIEPETRLLDQIWPTEQSTMYHLGGTTYWELEFQVTESSITLSTTTSGSKIHLSTIRTTCLDVVLETKRTDAETKRNVHRHKREIYFLTARMKRDVHNCRMSKCNTLIERQDIIFKNVTRKNILHNGIKMKWPNAAPMQSVTVEQLINNSQKLHESHHCKNNAKEKRTFYDFPYDNNEDSIMIKNRKLCGINGNKSKHQNLKHKNSRNVKNKHKNKQLTNPEKLRIMNSHSLKTCTNKCTVHKKNSDKHNRKMIAKNNTNFHSQTKNNNEKKQVIHRDVSIDRKNKSISIVHKRKVHCCSDCICDIMHVINNIKSILDRISYPLDEIKALNCSKYKEIEDKIVISIDSDIEEVKSFPQPHYNIESLKDQKYMKLEELEDDPKNYLKPENDHDIISLPGLNLNIPCNREGSDITWLSSISRPSYTWRKTDSVTLFGFVAENGDLELRNVNAKDTGNYTCIMTYTNPDNEEPIETTYVVHLQVVTLPKYILHGENHYRVRSCDDRDLDMLVTYFPLKLNSVICEADICNVYILTPFCSRNQITINILIVPSRITKLLTVDHKHCNVFCLKAIQDKLSMILSKNLQIFFGKTIIFRLPHVEQRLVSIPEKSSFARWKRGKTGTNTSGERFGTVGLFTSCPAGYGLRDSQCVPCDVDTYSEDGISHCKICPPGTHQPNHGARVCRTCTNPLTKGCYNMLWNSFSAVIVTLASVSVMLSFFLLILWIICCAKKKFCVKQIASITSQEDKYKQEKRMEEQPLIKDTSENEDQQENGEHTLKKKKGKFYVNKKRRKQDEKKRYGKTQIHKDEWGSHHMKETPIICLESYRSHEDYNYYPKQSYRKGPRLPECDFDT